MKTIFAAFLAVVAGSLSIQAKAAAVSATPVRTVYTCCNVLSSSYFEIVTALPKSIKAVSISNTGNVGIKVAVGSAGNEVDQLTIPAGSSTGLIYPLVVSGSQRISIKSNSSTAAVGEANFNFLYN